MATINNLINSLANLESRLTLEPKFNTGEIPAQADFYSLIHNPLSRKDDGMFKTLDQPLCIQSAGDPALNVLHLYATGDSEPAWQLNLHSDAFNMANSGGVRFQFSADGILQFPNNLQAKINFHGGDHGLGVQNVTLYFRSGDSFMWYKGGSHNNSRGNPGTGGVKTMELNGNGDLIVNRHLNATNGTVTAAAVDTGGILQFTSGNAIKIDLHNSTKAIGTQTNNVYFRTSGAFSWFRGGVHHNSANNPGSGGVSIMSLNNSGNLNVAGHLTANGTLIASKLETGGILQFSSSNSAKINLQSTDRAIGVQTNTLYFRTNNSFSWFRGGSHHNSANNPGSGGLSIMSLNSAGDLTIARNLNVNSGTMTVHTVQATVDLKATRYLIMNQGSINGYKAYFGNANNGVNSVSYGGTRGLDAHATSSGSDSKTAIMSSAIGDQGAKIGFRTYVTGVNGNKYGLYSYVQGDNDLKYGLYSSVNGNAGTKYGIFSSVNGNAGNKYGFYSSVSGNGGNKYGIYAYASGSGTNYAVFGSATGTTHYAGYFSGRVRVTQGIIGSFADYGEYFEASSARGIGFGIAVVFNEDGKIRAAKKGEVPFGITTNGSMIIGNSYHEWPGKYLRDEFDNPIMEEVEEVIEMPEEGVPVESDAELTEETGKKGRKKGKKKEVISNRITQKVLKPKINPKYDASKEYVPREDRSEWVLVGIMGQLKLRKGQPTAPNWIKIKSVNKTVDLWLVK